MHPRSQNESVTGRKRAQPTGATTLLRLSTVATLLCATAAFGQFRASLQGTVTDATGAAIPNATLTLLDTQTNRSLTATSNASGVYNFNALPADRFTLTATAPGFTEKVIKDLTITPEQANNIDVPLAVGNAGETVTVSSDTLPAIETSTASISGTITSEDIQRLPVIGRDVFQLSQLTPGLFGDGQRSAGGGNSSLPGTQGPGGSGNASGIFQTENGPQAIANGGQYETNGIYIDGISTASAVWGGTTIITPNPDAVDNLKITSNGYDAEFGRFSGATTQVTTRSGTNEIHGSAFFRVVRPGLNAFQRYNGPSSLLPSAFGPADVNTNVTRAAKRGLLRDTARYNDIGGSIGGPILKDRVFTFFAYETLRSSTASTVNNWYETNTFDAAAPSGNVSNKYTTFPNHGLVNATMINSTCGGAGLAEGPNCRTVNGGIDIGSPLRTARGTQDPTYVSSAIPGVGGGLDGVPDVALFQTATPSTQTQTQYAGRADANVTQKDHLAFSIYWQPESQTLVNGTARGYNQWNHNQTNNAYAVIYDHTFSPSLLNEARVNAAGWRWNEVIDNPQAPFGLPQDNINGLPNANIQFFGAAPPSHLNQWTYGYKDVATKTIRNHTVKFGGEATQLRYLQDPVGAARPSFSFYNIWNFLNDAPYNETGNFNRFTGVPFSNRYDMRQWIIGGFVQDDWKATPSLTFNLGLRYNYFDALYSKQNNLPHVVLGSGAVAFSSLQLVRGGKSWIPEKGNFGPQLGFAYNPEFLNRKFVIRGGYGLAYNQEEIAISANQSNSPNDQVSPSFNNSTPAAADPRIQYNIPGDSRSLFGYASNPNTIVNYGANGLPTTGTFNLTNVPYHLKTQQVSHYSLALEGDLGHQMAATVLYEGSTGHHLIFHQNAYLYGQAHGVTYNPASTYIETFGDTGGSNFNALVVDVRHNLAHQFSVDASFTYSKSMDDNSGPYYIDPYTYNPLYARGRSDYNVGKAFKVFGLYNPKFFYGSNPIGKVLLNGFTVSGIYNLHTGFPWTPVRNYGGTNAYYTGSGVNTLRPTAYLGGAGRDSGNSAFINVPTSPGRNFSRGGQSYFSTYDPTAIATTSTTFPAPIQFFPAPGLARNSLDGPRYQALDASVTKSFGIPNRYLGERTGFEFRMDASNVLNITNLQGGSLSNGGGIVNDVTSPDFGVANAGLAGRQVQLQARITF